MAWVSHSIYSSWSSATGTKTGVLEGCHAWIALLWVTLNVQLKHVTLKPEAIKNLKLWVFLEVLFLWGCSSWISTSSWHAKIVCPLYLKRFHSQYASHGHQLEEWLQLLPKECLKVGLFDVHYQCITAWWHWLFNKDEGVVLNHLRN